MAYQLKYSDKRIYRQRRTYNPESYRKSPQPQHMQRSSHSSDYICRPAYSISDYISNPSDDTHSGRRSHASRSSSSDYISQPVRSKHDYISPRQDDDGSRSSSTLAYHGRDAQKVSRNYFHARNVASKHSSNPDWSVPQADKSNYQIIKGGGWNHKHNFMRIHGLTSWNQEDYDEAHAILDKYRELEAQSDCESVGSHYKGRRTEQGHCGAIEQEGYYGCHHHEDTEMYSSGSDVASYRGGASSLGSARRSLPKRSEFCSKPLEQGSDYEDVLVSSDEDDSLAGTLSGSDYASHCGQNMPNGSDYESSDCKFSDEDESLEGSDYVYSSGEQDDGGEGDYGSDVCSDHESGLDDGYEEGADGNDKDDDNDDDK